MSCTDIYLNIQCFIILNAHIQLGDPTVYGNIPPCPAITAAITTSLQSSMSYGYINACGTLQARIAIAKHHSSHRFQRKMLNEDDNTSGGDNIDANCVAADGLPITPDDVIIANGVSGALELALTALLDEDTVLLGESIVLLCDVYYVCF